MADGSPIEQVPLGSHGFAVYDAPPEQLTAAVPFIRGGLSRGNCCFYVYEDVPLAGVKQALRAGGIDVAAQQRSGALIFNTPRQWAPGGTSPEAALNLMAARIEHSVRAGFAGVYAAINKTWIASDGLGTNWERAYEMLAISRLHLLALSVLCMYDRRRLPPDTLLEVYRLHRWVTIEGEVQLNLFYEPPEHLLAAPSAQERVAWMHEQLVRLHRSARRLRQREQEFQVLVENASDGILRFDRDLRLVYINQAAARLRGRPAAELIGKTTEEAGFAVAGTPGWELALRHVLRTGRELTIDVQGRLLTGDVGVYRCRLMPVFDADGTVSSVMNVARDITERKRADEDLDKLYRELIDHGSRLREMLGQIVVGQAAQRRRERGALELQQLTQREREILRLLAQGRTNQQIGQAIGLSAGTVRNYVSRLLSKLGAVDRTQAVALAFEWGILD